MDYNKVLKYQNDLAKAYKYKPIPPMFREETVKFYKENLPEFFSLAGDNVPLFSHNGLKLCNRYNRIVIGDYGAFVEILPEDIIHENIKVKKGQEYRDFDERYSSRVKYSWLTTTDGSDIKIYFQKKPVDYADYVPGRYYISPYECFFSKTIERGADSLFNESKVAEWLKKQGVFRSELVERYRVLSSTCCSLINEAVERDLSPVELDYWMCLNEVCNVDGGLSYERFQAVSYNLSVIDCRSEELKAPLDTLEDCIRTAIRMGMEGLEFPYEVNILDAGTVRLLLNLSAHDLLNTSHLCKVFAGCKADYSVEKSPSVEGLISRAEERADTSCKTTSQEFEKVM